MDPVASCKDKLAHFRIKELKDVLTHLGLSKQGKKQDLVDRIMAILSGEEGIWNNISAGRILQVVKLVDDTYRKMQGSCVTELASKSIAASDGSNMKLKEETVDSFQMEKIRCLCGSTLATDSMIKCENSRCDVWQHMACVLVPEKPADRVPPNPPESFYCELCRLSRADPFWQTISHPMYPVKLNITNVPSDGSNPGQSIEKTFQLTRADRDLLSKQGYGVQAWCMLLNDKVTYRMQWPQYADLQVNGVPVRAINRPGSQLLGANGRDDGAAITPYTRDGINKISLTGCDARIFCLGVRIVRQRTLHQVINMIPNEVEGEPFEEALARVRRCVGGGAVTENADSDSDIEVVADCIPVNLRCPMSGLRIKVAGRFKHCAHMGCFDLEVFVEMNQRSRKWQCPICLKNYSLEKIIIDPYFNRITSKMRNCGEDLAEIEVKPDGSWRVKAEGNRGGLGELGLWHLPDGTIGASVDAESKPKLELKSIKQECGSDSHSGLRLGMKKNRNGCWEISKPDDMRRIASPNICEEKIEKNGQHIIAMSSSSVSGRDCGDASVNQDGMGNLDFSMLNGTECESISMNIDPTHGLSDLRASKTAQNTEVIVLSDSEEEDIEPVISGAVPVPDTSGLPSPAPRRGNTDSFYENPIHCNGGSSCLGFYSMNGDELGVNTLSLPSASQDGPGFHLFGSDKEVCDALVDLQHGQRDQPGSLNCSSPVTGYTLTAETAMVSAPLVPVSGAQHSNSNGGSADDLSIISGNDPSLQIFLPTRSADASALQSDMRSHPDVSNGTNSGDWISLRLGDGGGSGDEFAAAKGLNPGLQSQQADASVEDGSSNKTGRERSDGPFQFRRQRRSVRPRLYLSINSESE